jgi:hypothetical protein
MRGRLVTILCAFGMVFASAALAAAPPIGGGTYKGSDTSGTISGSSRSVTLSVTPNRANFAGGRFNFLLKGRAGLGSCAGPAYVYLSPTRVRQITRKGTFDLSGHFTFKAPTPYGSVKYATTVRIIGAFTSAGKRVSGTLSETARNKGLTCRSGLLHFKATLAR